MKEANLQKKDCIVFDSMCMPLWKGSLLWRKINNLVVSFKFLPSLLSAPTILTVYVRVNAIGLVILENIFCCYFCCLFFVFFAFQI